MRLSAALPLYPTMTVRELKLRIQKVAAREEVPDRMGSRRISWYSELTKPSSPCWFLRLESNGRLIRMKRVVLGRHHVWRVNCLTVNGQRLLEDNARLRDVGVTNGSIITFSHCTSCAHFGIPAGIESPYLC